MALIVAVLGADYALATAQLDDVVIETSLDPPRVAADGRNSVVITVRITQNGRPRANDLVQAWIGSGSGLLIPNWVITDEHGTARITYTPNPYSPYDPQEAAEIRMMDTSIGRLVEVSKRHTVRVPLLEPGA
jgi:hypothetical protein